jgi:hypothetical protein
MIFSTQQVSITAMHGKTMDVDIDVSVADVIEAAGEADILAEIGVKETIAHFGADELLEAIGRDAAISHFEIEEATGE